MPHTLSHILKQNAKYATKDELDKLIIIFVDINKGEQGVKAYSYKHLINDDTIDKNERYEQHTWKGGFTIVLCPDNANIS